MRSKFLVCLLSGFFFAGAALADTKLGTDEVALKAAIEKKFPDIKLDSLQKTQYGGLYEAVMEGSQVFYTDKNASFILVGNLIDAKTQRNVTEERIRDLMRVKFDTLPLESAIKQVKGNGSRKMAVFSDPDCPYCRKLDAELAKVTDVTIYTFLYPIASLHPQAGDKAKAVWCAPDRVKAWEDLIQKGTVPQAGGKCENPLAKIAELGRKLKVNGTPTIIFADGMRVPGMVPAANLEKLLNGERSQH
ncbi:DsbC family protein [Sulfuricella sp.]|uniref:DsbC family protein n=1 Tax=Sulfuricella sp. TaxID=2099377 RepID=UPI002C5DFB41|nr:DsbC family protein [Sulfuricella sp.]HUX62568.1 DsbC family protein [Sulfuricella sp.]